MKWNKISPDPSVALFVKAILIFEEVEDRDDNVLSFYADGYPGLMYHETRGGMCVQPQNKKMPPAYLYGQTIHPIDIHLKGAYRIMVFQLYPFVLNSLFNVDPQLLNNDCYNLEQHDHWSPFAQRLSNQDVTAQICIIQEFVSGLVSNKKKAPDAEVGKAIGLILDRRAQISVKEICEALFLTPRSLERRFLKAVGLSAKDFIQITRFQQSLEQLAEKQFTKLTDIVYTNGFADQSHFIRVFKAFTGKTPRGFRYF
ncbi:helix-turn-helix domain-containing protein [Niabella yanshanensis]|uniref:Helix-turn-helix domain-containing protein n=1 Tax=Niabella yanshanensis TaxID=577386 RepID=A0ABZ0WAJ4_9BACT|nr:helix-turn-helix domain-containing protein [Niabella yanshanensis]WQD39165.1 helix-turn-helix domain-containing protein [Niabella yanshanensis]